MRLILIFIILHFPFGTIAQVDKSLDSYEGYLSFVKSDAELYEMHKSANRYMDKAQGYSIASGIFLSLATFGAITVNSSGRSDPQPGSLVLMSVGGILGGLTGLVAIGSYSKGKSKRRKIKKILGERYGVIDNYSLSIRSSSNGIGLVCFF